MIGYSNGIALVVGQSARLLDVHIGSVMREPGVSGRDRRGSGEPSEPFHVCMRSKQRIFASTGTMCGLLKEFCG